MGYSLRGRKESDTTERLHFHFIRKKVVTLLGEKKKERLTFFLKTKCLLSKVLGETPHYQS